MVLENLSYEWVIGSASAPYLNGLADQFGLATNFFANDHPSIGNYFMMTAGQIVTSDDDYAGPFTGDNLARRIAAAGKRWKVYAQSLPSAGYTGGDQYPYIRHHNPFAYFSDVIGTPQANNIVPYSHLASDLSAGALPDLLFLVPDNQHNGHDCSGGGTGCDPSERVGIADTWAQQNLPALLNSPAFSNGVLVVTFDEADFSDGAHGGGHIVTIVAGPRARRGFRSDTFFQHEHLLRFVCDRLALASCPGAGAGASGGLAAFLQ